VNFAEAVDGIIAAGQHQEKLLDDLPYFAEHCLKLRPKAGPIEPFKFNAAQLQLHKLIEEQKAKTGRVRVIVLKARQLGVSTYVAARFFHRVINNPGLRCIILGHERRASSNLYGIVRRFFDHLPEGSRPSVGISNAEELVFDRIDSGYLVAVATGDGTGRSATAQMLHGSEVAFWPDLPAQLAALLQTVPDIDSSEIILESTANGFNDFSNLWRKAQAGESEFLPVFLPWSLDAAYTRPVEADFELTSDEAELATAHNLSNEQINWRRNKINQLGSPDLLAQEYPIVAAEAFIAQSFDSFISPELVLKARREKISDPYGPLLVGVDPAGTGPDRTSIAWRRGHCILKVQSRRGLDTMQTCGWVSRIIADEKPDRVFIDVGGLGVGIYDRLIELGHSRIVKAVNFGGKVVGPLPFDESGKPTGGAANRRAELWMDMRKALENGRFSLPDSDSLQADLTSVGYKFDSSGRLLLEAKKDVKARTGMSPDEGDAVALCISEPTGFPRNPSFNRRDLHDRLMGLYV
jgi:hypothetical protein